MKENLVRIDLEDYDESVFKFVLGDDVDFDEEITKLTFDQIEGYYYITSYFEGGRVVNKFAVADIKQLGLGYLTEVEGE